MKKYIDKTAIVAELERRRDAALRRQHNLEIIGQETVLNEMVAFELNRIISLINTLEVKEVDFEKELNEYGLYYDYTSFDRKEMVDFAKHFFELGLKVNKEE